MDLKKSRFTPPLYAVVWVCFALMFFFIVPMSDVLIFSYSTEDSLRGITDAAFRYGNGRFLGNWLSMFFSHHFVWAFLVVACFFTGIVRLLNRLTFADDPRTVLPVAFLVAFPSVGMLEDCYCFFAAFVNYTAPVFFVLLAFSLARGDARKKRRPFVRLLLGVGVFLSAFAGALFSENTTVVLLTLAVLTLVSDVAERKKPSSGSLCLLLGALIGTACMLAIPVLSESAYKMNEYRHLAVRGVSELLRNSMAVFFRFAAVINACTPVILLLSVAFLLLLRGKGDRPIYVFARLVFAVYPAFSLAVTAMQENFYTMIFSQAIHVFPVLLYAAAILIGVRAIPEKRDRLRAHGFILLLMSSVCPMLLVSQYGPRTFYTTFIVLLTWALTLLRAQKDALLAAFSRLRLRAKPCTAALACVWLLCGVFLGQQNMINFDFFAARSAIIAQEAEKGTPVVTVPYVPCHALSPEENWPNKVADILPDKSVIELRKTNDISSCTRAEEYKALYSSLHTGSPLYPLQYAFGHLAYKNPNRVHEVFAGPPSA